MYEIREYCKNNKITKTQFAEELNISIAYISKLDYNQIEPNERIKNELLKRNILINVDSTKEKRTKANEIIETKEKTIKELREINQTLNKKLLKILNKKLIKIENDLKELQEIKEELKTIIEETKKTLN